MLTVILDSSKRSAGLVLLSGRRVLLLKRSKAVRNSRRWGLPGGQLDAREQPYQAALREAREELVHVPPHRLVGEAAVQRGARRYELFAGRTSRGLRDTWEPSLNEEHTDWRWASLGWLREHRGALHPVLRALLDDPDGARWLTCVVRADEPHKLRHARRSTDGVLSAAR
jgi:8-oxo-dGTP pyrophosphatase MutT (NUDIX family)